MLSNRIQGLSGRVFAQKAKLNIVKFYKTSSPATYNQLLIKKTKLYDKKQHMNNKE